MNIIPPSKIPFLFIRGFHVLMLPIVIPKEEAKGYPKGYQVGE